MTNIIIIVALSILSLINVWVIDTKVRNRTAVSLADILLGIAAVAVPASLAYAFSSKVLLWTMAVLVAILMTALVVSAFKNVKTIRHAVPFIGETLIYGAMLHNIMEKVANLGWLGCIIGTAALVALLIAIIVKCVETKKLYKLLAMLVALALLIGIGWLIIGHLPEKKEEAPVAPTTAPTATVTPTPTTSPAENAKDLEDQVSSFTDAALLKKYGTRLYFSPSSTLAHLSARSEVTGIFDAVNYNFTNSGDGWLVMELLSNPIYLMDCDKALEELGLVTDADWAKKFRETEDYNDYIELVNGNWMVSKEYHLMACRYAEVIKAGNFYEETVDDWKVIKHWPLNPTEEKVIESTEEEKYHEFYVIEFEFKDGTVKYLGINTLDGRFAVLEKTSKKTSKTTKKPVVTPTPKCEPENIPDNKGNAPVGGTGTDGVDDLGPGVYQPTEPVHVEKDQNKDNDTRVEVPIRNNDPEIKVDSNEPNNAPIVVDPTTTYVNPNTGNASLIINDPVNSDVDFDCPF